LDPYRRGGILGSNLSFFFNASLEILAYPFKFFENHHDLRMKSKGPIFFLRIWGLVSLLNGPTFRLEVAGINKAKIITVNINHNKELKSNPNLGISKR
jgi:hypothetical protein